MHGNTHVVGFRVVVVIRLLSDQEASGSILDHPFLFFFSPPMPSELFPSPYPPSGYYVLENRFDSHKVSKKSEMNR